MTVFLGCSTNSSVHFGFLCVGLYVWDTVCSNKIFFCLCFTYKQDNMHDTITTNALHKEKSHIDFPSMRLMRVSYVITLNVVEKFWTPTHRHSYTTVNSNHAERLANKHPAGSYL